MVTPSARHLVLDLLSTLPHGAVPVRALVAAGALFAISENSIRVALARAVHEGLLERDERGAYRAGPRAAGVSQQVASWRHLDTRLRRWDGAWLGVHLGGLPTAARSVVRRRHRALDWLGFRELRPGLAIRADNLRDGITGVRSRLHALGLDGGVAVFELRGLDTATDAAARRLWPTASLLAGYRATRLALERSAARLPALPEAQAMTESFTLGGQAIRQLALDPLLPDEMLPGAERARLFDALRRYDRTGRACWAPFLARFGVLPHTAQPRLRAAGGIR